MFLVRYINAAICYSLSYKGDHSKCKDCIWILNILCYELFLVPVRFWNFIFPFSFRFKFSLVNAVPYKIRTASPKKNCVFGELNDTNLDYLFYLVGDFQKFQCKNNKQIIFDKKKQQNFFFVITKNKNFVQLQWKSQVWKKQKMTNQPTQEYWNNWKKYIKNWSSLRTSDKVGWTQKFELKKFQRFFSKKWFKVEITLLNHIEFMKWSCKLKITRSQIDWTIWTSSLISFYSFKRNRPFICKGRR